MPISAAFKDRRSKESFLFYAVLVSKTKLKSFAVVQSPLKDLISDLSLSDNHPIHTLPHTSSPQKKDSF